MKPEGVLCAPRGNPDVGRASARHNGLIKRNHNELDGQGQPLDFQSHLLPGLLFYTRKNEPSITLS